MIRQSDIDTIMGKSQIKNPEKWEVKMGGEKMSDKIQMTEEQGRKFFIDIFSDYFDSESETLSALKIAKEKGYIRKNPVEEAEELWQKWNNREFDATERVSLIIKFYEAIQYLKERQK